MKTLKFSIGLILGCIIGGIVAITIYFKFQNEQPKWHYVGDDPLGVIVFSIKKDSLGSTFGFINPDGANFRVVPNENTGHLNVPAWSRGGDYISVRFSVTEDPLTDWLHIIETNSGKYLDECDNWGYANGRSRIIENNKIVMHYRKPNDDYDRVVLADIKTCEILETLFIAPESTDVMMIESVSMSKSGDLAITYVYWGNRKNEVVIIDEGTKESHVLDNGGMAEWSPDGEWLAYTGYDGVYISKVDGKEKQRLTEFDKRVLDKWYEFPFWHLIVTTPSWSPDGEWVVYHKPTKNGPEIYKYNIKTDNEVFLFRGGYSPDWRWDK